MNADEARAIDENATTHGSAPMSSRTSSTPRSARTQGGMRRRVGRGRDSGPGEKRKAPSENETRSGSGPSGPER